MEGVEGAIAPAVADQPESPVLQPLRRPHATLDRVEQPLDRNAKRFARVEQGA